MDRFSTCRLKTSLAVSRKPYLSNEWTVIVFQLQIEVVVFSFRFTTSFSTIVSYFETMREILLTGHYNRSTQWPFGTLASKHELTGFSGGRDRLWNAWTRGDSSGFDFLYCWHLLTTSWLAHQSYPIFDTKEYFFVTFLIFSVRLKQGIG